MIAPETGSGALQAKPPVLPAALLLIHGVGDAPDAKTRAAGESLIEARLGGSRARSVLWYEWNEAVEKAEPDKLDYLRAVAYATRRAAKLEMPDEIGAGGLRAALWQAAEATGKFQMPVMAAFLVSCLWLALAWAANMVHEEPPPLDLGVRISSVLFPPLDPTLLEGTSAAARMAVRTMALTALVLVPALHFALAAASGAVSFRVALRCVVLDATRPLIALLTSPGQVVLTMAILAGLLAFLFGFFSRPVQNLDMDGTPLDYGGGRLAIFGLPAALLAGGAVFAAFARILRPLIKVMSDIVRYLGAPGYRGRIHADLLEKLAQLEPGPVVVVAHSLGTVIAVDSLLAYPEAWSRFSSVRLLTCGSPLKRLFHRFFPANYPAPTVLAGMLAALYSGFRWRNAYRPLDYIGGGLGGGDIEEAPFTQRCHLHIQYWTDDRLAAIIAAELGSAASGPSAAAVAGAGARLSVERLRYGHVGGDRGLEMLLRAVHVAGYALIAATQIAWTPELERKHVQVWQDRLHAHGVEVDGRLCPNPELDTSSQNSTAMRAVAHVRFTGRDGGTHRLFPNDDGRPDVDWAKVERAVFGQALDSALITGLRAMIGSPDPMLKKKECKEVRVRYLADDPRVFRLPPDFHKSPAPGPVTRVGRILALALLWLAWWASIAAVLRAVLGGRAPRVAGLKEPGSI